MLQCQVNQPEAFCQLSLICDHFSALRHLVAKEIIPNKGPAIVNMYSYATQVNSAFMGRCNEYQRKLGRKQDGA